MAVNITLQGPSVCEADMLGRRWTNNGAYNYREDVMMNFGAEDRICMGSTPDSAWYSWKNLMKWDLSSIPAGSTINTAVMQLYKYYLLGTNRYVDVYGMTRSYVHGPHSGTYHNANCPKPNGGSWWCDYDIGYVTAWYRQRPSGTVFGVFGIGNTGQACHPGGGGCGVTCADYCWHDENGPNPGDDCDAAYTCRVGPSLPIDNWYDFNIQPLVSDWVNGVRSNYGMFLTYNAGNGRSYYRSAEYTGDTTKQPKLVINYEPPAASQIINLFGNVGS